MAKDKMISYVPDKAVGRKITSFAGILGLPKGRFVGLAVESVLVELEAGTADVLNGKVVRRVEPAAGAEVTGRAA